MMPYFLSANDTEQKEEEIFTTIKNIADELAE